MKKIILAILIVFLIASNSWAITGAKGASCITGGTSNCLDYFDGSTLSNGDVAIVVVSEVYYFYVLDADSAVSESSPNVISPNSNAGDKRWVLKGILHDPTMNTLADDATPSISAGTTFLTGGTTTITDFDDGYTGKIIRIIAEHSITITDGTNIFLSGSANWAMTATDTLTLIQKADGKWYELSRGDNGA